MQYVGCNTLVAIRLWFCNTFAVLQYVGCNTFGFRGNPVIYVQYVCFNTFVFLQYVCGFAIRLGELQYVWVVGRADTEEVRLKRFPGGCVEYISEVPCTGRCKGQQNEGF